MADEIIENFKEATIFTPTVTYPIEEGYLELSERYVEIRERLNELVDSVKDVVITEEYLTTATEIQKEVNGLWKEIEEARKSYHNLVDSLFYTPIAEKIEKEIKVKFQEWENTFKASKTDIENQLLEKRVGEISTWFTKVAAEQGLEWLTLKDVQNQKAVTITRKNKPTDIIKNCNAFIDKVKSDVAVLRDGYGDEEIAEYQKSFNAATAIAIVKARREEVEKAKQVIAMKETPLVQEIVQPQVQPVQEPIPTPQVQPTPQPVQADGLMTRTWEITGTKEQLVEIAKTIKKLGAEYKVLGG